MKKILSRLILILIFVTSCTNKTLDNNVSKCLCAQKYFSIKDLKSGVVALNVYHKDNSLYAASGFLISNNLLITNYHVIAGEIKEIKVLWDVSLKQKSISAEIYKINQDADLAILKLKEKIDSYFFSLEKNEKLEYGEDILIVGYPEVTQSENEELKFIHVFKGNIASIIDDEDIKKIVLDARVFKGTSGGPVLSLKTGKLIGIITEIILDSEEEIISLPSGKTYKQSVEGESVGIAISSNFLLDLLK